MSARLHDAPEPVLGRAQCLLHLLPGDPAGRHRVHGAVRPEPGPAGEQLGGKTVRGEKGERMGRRARPRDEGAGQLLRRGLFRGGVQPSLFPRGRGVWPCARPGCEGGKIEVSQRRARPLFWGFFCFIVLAHQRNCNFGEASVHQTVCFPQKNGWNRVKNESSGFQKIFCKNHPKMLKIPQRYVRITM